MVDNAPHQGLPCPVCKVALVMSERQGIEIDYCPQCRGVWLDRGELDKIIERSMAEQPTYQEPSSTLGMFGDKHGRSGKHGGGHGSSHGGGHGGRKGFLRNLFD
jgi:uncharacterized protein